MRQNLTDLGLPNVWGVLFTPELDVIEVFPKNFDSIDIRALAEISEVLKEWISTRGISEIVDAEINLYAGKIGEKILYVSGDPNTDFMHLWEVVLDVKNRYASNTKI